MAHLMPLLLTISCFSKIQIGFTFLVPAHLGSPGQRAVKRLCVVEQASGLFPYLMFGPQADHACVINPFIVLYCYQEILLPPKMRAPLSEILSPNSGLLTVIDQSLKCVINFA